MKRKIFLAVILLLFGSVVMFSNEGFAKSKLKFSVKITNISRGTKKQLKVKGVSTKKIKFKTSNRRIAYVNSKGMVRGNNVGTAKITATIKGTKKKTTCTVKVVQKATAIALTEVPTTPVLQIGSSYQLGVAITPTTTTNKKTTWSTSKSKIASVTSSGKVKAIKAGNVTISATTKDGSKKKASKSFLIGRQVTSLTLNQTSVYSKSGTMFQLTTTLKPSNATIKKLAFASSNPSVATVSDSGLVACVSKGTTVVTAYTTDGSGITASCTVSVSALLSTDAKFIAHRGMESIAPENTLISFELACKEKYWGVECDVRLTSDDEFVISHDENINRTTGVDANISDLDLATLKTYPITTGNNVTKYETQYIPTLEQYISLIASYPDKELVIELKSDFSNTHIKRILKLLEDNKVTNRTTFISFNATNLSRIHEQDETIPLQYIVDKPGDNDVLWCIEQGFGLCTNFNYITKEIVSTMHANNLLVNLYTVDAFNNAYGFITDYKVDYITSGYKHFTD